MKFQTHLSNRKELRYILSGTLSEVIEYISFIVIFNISNLLYLSNSISFALGVISGFALHKAWTFRGEQLFKTHQQFVGYISLAGINFIAINAFLGLYVEAFKFSPEMAKLFAIATTVIWTYLISNFIIFRHPVDKS
jgi:putative flippase GtrA